MIKNHFYILFFTFYFFVFLGCSNDEELKNIQEYTGPIVEVDSSVTFYSDSAIVRVKVIAAKRLDFQNGNQEYPDGFYIEFYEIDGKISSTLKANKGFYNKENDLYSGIGDVVYRSIVKDEQLNTEELFWKKSEQRVFTDKFVRIETQGDILTGEGLTAKQDFSSYSILKPTGTWTNPDFE